MGEIRYFCNQTTEDLKENRLNHPPDRLVLYSKRLPKHLLEDAIFATEFMPVLYWEIRQVIGALYGVDLVGSFTIRHGRLRAEFFANTAGIREEHREALAEIAKLRWPGASEEEKRAYVMRHFNSKAFEVILDAYILKASGVFDAALKQMYEDYLDRAITMLNEEVHPVYDEIIIQLFPARAERKKAEVKAKNKSIDVMMKRARRKQEEKARKARGRMRVAQIGSHD